MKTLHKKIYHIHSLLLLVIVTGVLFLSSCKEDNPPPVISNLRNYAASPNDTILETVSVGQWVIVEGENLSGVTQVYFGGIAATINTTYFSDSYIVIQIPAIPFQLVPTDKLHEITVINESGMATFAVNITGAPIISYIRNYEESPNDMILDTLFGSMEINLVGYNLLDATHITFQGIQADLNNVVYTDSSVILQIPSDLSGSDASLANLISYTTGLGTTTFPIRIIGPAIISRVSFEIPKDGDLVYLYGYNFLNIQNITFAGEIISDYEVLSDSVIRFISPALSQTGPVEITTASGIGNTKYNVNDVNTGAISNFGDTFNWDWWAATLGVEDQSFNDWGWITIFPEFKGNGTKFLVIDGGSLATGQGDEWGNAIRITNNGNGYPWFPSVDNLTDPAGSWALKFEFNVTEDWNGSSLCIKTTNGDYMVRYEPWQVSSTKQMLFKTEGWQTVTIPLNSFRKNESELGDGKGAPIDEINDLFDEGSINGTLVMYLHNYGTSDATRFHAAFDNFRVVKR